MSTFLLLFLSFTGALILAGSGYAAWLAAEHFAEYRERLMSWRDRIREVLEPVRTTDLRDTRCPACGNLHARRLQDGEVVRRPTLHVTYSDPPVAVCLTCLSTWTGGELLDLRDGRV